MNIKRTVSWLWSEQRVEMKNLLRMVENEYYFTLQERIRGEVHVLNQTINSARAYGTVKSVRLLQQERAEFMKLLELIENRNFYELYLLLKEKLDNMAKEAKHIEFLTVLEQISPKELAHAMAMATQQQQRAAQQQMEKIERLQQVMEEEGTPYLRKRSQELEDERQEEIRLLLMLLFLWFLLCYCSEGSVCFLDVELTFGLSLVLSEIVLLLGGDIEKNPGPLTGILVYWNNISLWYLLSIQIRTWQRWTQPTCVSRYSDYYTPIEHVHSIPINGHDRLALNTSEYTTLT